MARIPSIDRLNEVLCLDPETGILTWKITLSPRAVAGKVAGCIEKRRKYVLVRIDGVLYRAHVLIWFMLHGEWCPREIDHWDRVTSNNRPSNLRKATESQQSQNKAMQSNNTSGYRGVTAAKDGCRWTAQYQLFGKNHYLGTFASKEEAAEVARIARLNAFSAFAPDYDQGSVLSWR